MVVTWPDGCALELFLLATTQIPNAEALRAAVREADATSLDVVPVPDAQLDFDDAASPWSTVLRVRRADTPGVLGSVAGAIAAAGVDVHSAEIGVEGTAVVDTFELTVARQAGP